MVIVLSSSVVDHGFEPWLGQTKDYKIGICCISAKHAAGQIWLAWNQDNVQSEATCLPLDNKNNMIHSILFDSSWTLIYVKKQTENNWSLYYPSYQPSTL
jgi:hypothetical protein